MRKISVKDKLLTKVKEKSLVRPKDFENIKGARVHLSQLVESGELIKSQTWTLHDRGKRFRRAAEFA